MTTSFKNRSLLGQLLYLIAALILIIIVVSLVLAVVKLLIPLVILGAIVAGAIYLFNKTRSS